MFLETKFHEMENVSRMDRAKVACDSYCAQHGLCDGTLESEEAGIEDEELIGETDQDEDGDGGEEGH